MIQNRSKDIGFKLLELEIHNHPVFKEKVIFSFVNLEDDFEKPYSTVIIGPNGTGKSFLLSFLANLFLKLEKISKREKIQINESFRIKYIRHGHLYEIGNVNTDKLKLSGMKIFTKKGIKKQLWFLRDQEEIKAKQITLPKKIITNSVLITDRFTIPKDNPEIFQYLGIRQENRPNIAGTRTLIQKTSELIFSRLVVNDLEFLLSVGETLEYLNFERSFEIVYEPRYAKYFFSGDLTPERFKELFENFWVKGKGFSRRSKDKPSYGIEYYFKEVKNDESLIIKLTKVLNEITSENFKNKEGSKSRIISYSLLETYIYRLDHFPIINILRKLDLLSYPSIILKRNNVKLNLDQISSGEYHLFNSLVGLLASTHQHSLILIDEPEISLHPNWQMKFIEFLNKLFDRFYTCHFIIATHSHFLISDLDGRNAKILGLHIDQDKSILVEDINMNTFGWSAEEVLLKIFKLPTLRNYFIGEKITNILELISHSQRDEGLIREKVQELKDLNIENISADDPFRPALDKLLERYG